MGTFLHPGVYVLEVPSGARSIEGVPTGITIFVGETEFGPLTPTRVRGRTDYERLFGGYMRARDVGDPTRVFMPYAIDGYFSNGGSVAFVLRAFDNPAGAAAATRSVGGNALFQAASPGMWPNNRVAITVTDSSDADANRFRIVVFYTSPGDGVERLVESFDRLSTTATDENYVIDVLRRSRYIRWNEAFAAANPARDIAGTNLTEQQLSGAAVDMAGGVGGGNVLATGDFPALLNSLAEVDDAALLVAASDQMIDGTLNDNAYVTFTNNFITYADNRPQRDLFFVGDLPRLTVSNAADPVAAALNHINGTGGATIPLATTFTSLFWPHVRVADPVGSGTNPTIVIPPSGYVAGLFNQTDGRRGVWKAPAGTDVVIGNVVGLDFNVLDTHQDDLNPRGINALRRIPSAGPVIWGARTRRPDTEYRYIPVRRTAMFLRKSIYRGIQWAVFEPNDEPLWGSLRNTIGAFMETQFRNGAFAGRTSREAYFVKCDAETTTPIDQAAGVVNILVGFAPLRPAEFVVVRLSQKTAEQN